MPKSSLYDFLKDHLDFYTISKQNTPSSFLILPLDSPDPIIREIHLSFYESYDDTRFVVSQYHATVVTDSHRFHLYFNKNDILYPDILVNNKNGTAFQNEATDTESHGKIIQLVLPSVRQTMSMIRQKKQQTLIPLIEEFEAKEAELCSLSQRLDENRDAYIESLKVIQSTLERIVLLQDAGRHLKKYRGIYQFFQKMQNCFLPSHQKPELPLASLEEESFSEDSRLNTEPDSKRGGRKSWGELEENQRKLITFESAPDEEKIKNLEQMLLFVKAQEIQDNFSSKKRLNDFLTFKRELEKKAKTFLAIALLNISSASDPRFLALKASSFIFEYVDARLCSFFLTQKRFFMLALLMSKEVYPEFPIQYQGKFYSNILDFLFESQKTQPFSEVETQEIKSMLTQNGINWMDLLLSNPEGIPLVHQIIAAQETPLKEWVFEFLESLPQESLNAFCVALYLSLPPENSEKIPMDCYPIYRALHGKEWQRVRESFVVMHGLLSQNEYLSSIHYCITSPRVKDLMEQILEVQNDFFSKVSKQERKLTEVRSKDSADKRMLALSEGIKSGKLAFPKNKTNEDLEAMFFHDMILVLEYLKKYTEFDKIKKAIEKKPRKTKMKIQKIHEMAAVLEPMVCMYSQMHFPAILHALTPQLCQMIQNSLKRQAKKAAQQYQQDGAEVIFVVPVTFNGLAANIYQVDPTLSVEELKGIVQFLSEEPDKPSPPV